MEYKRKLISVICANPSKNNVSVCRCEVPVREVGRAKTKKVRDDDSRRVNPPKIERSTKKKTKNTECIVVNYDYRY